MIWNGIRTNDLSAWSGKIFHVIDRAATVIGEVESKKGISHYE
jgi:hypothetical protein